MDPFIGQIVGFGGNFAPRSWAFCDGQLLAISTNTALFSILGTIYGGDGRTTFALPDLRGRSPLEAGNGPGLSPITLGQKGGAESFSLTNANQLPAHNHTASLHGETAVANAVNPQGKLLAGGTFYAAPVPADNKTLAAESIVVANTGGSAPVHHVPPFLGIHWIIALVGTYPSRN